MPDSFFFSFYETLPRQGPGSDEATRKALAMLPGLPAEPAVLDVGCGSGAQTLELARCTAGHITAVDIFPSFLKTLEKRAEIAGFSDRITTQLASMNDLPFPQQSFDLIWSEGAIYIMGFEAGLRAWKPFLRPEGMVVVSELSWFTPTPSPALRAFWGAEYPDMRSIPANLDRIHRAGYQLIGHFHLPTEAWWDNYYGPMEHCCKQWEDTYASNDEVMAFLQVQLAELELFRRHSDEYGYEFYLMQAE